MIKIIDLYSGNAFNPGQIKMDGYVGVVFKGGQGAWADVPRVHPEWWQQARDFGLLRGWYWLADSRYHSSSHIDEMGKWGILEDQGELGLAIDVEKPVLSWTEDQYYQTPFAGADNIVDLTYLLTLRLITPKIYTGPGAYELVTRYAGAAAHNWLSQFKLWTAQYPKPYIEGVSKPDMYGKWPKHEWWQYREGPDVNLFNGTDAEFHAAYNTVPTIPTPGEETMYKGTVLVSLNIRTLPDAGSPSLGKFLINDKVEASTVEAGWWKIVKITRAGLNVPLPSAVCYAYEGSTKGYIRTDSIVADPTPTTPSEDISVSVVRLNGVTKVTVDGKEFKE